MSFEKEVARAKAEKHEGMCELQRHDHNRMFEAMLLKLNKD